jgi:hypothetical protein
MKTQGVPRAKASGRPVEEAGGSDFNGISQVQKGELRRRGAHLAYGLTLRGLRQTQISLGDNGGGTEAS